MGLEYVRVRGGGRKGKKQRKRAKRRSSREVMREEISITYSQPNWMHQIV